jgi:hypothetical protein
MAGAIADYGAEAVLKTWELFCTPFLPVTVVVLRASELSDQARAHGLDPAQVEDAIALLGYLRASNDPHAAWLSGELVRKHGQNLRHFHAAMAAPYKAPDDGKSELTMPGLSGGGAADEADPPKLAD